MAKTSSVKTGYPVGFLLTAVPKFGVQVRSLFKVAKTTDTTLQGHGINNLNGAALPLQWAKPAWFQAGDVLLDDSLKMEILNVDWDGKGVSLTCIAKNGVFKDGVDCSLKYLQELQFVKVLRRRPPTLKEL